MRKRFIERVDPNISYENLKAWSEGLGGLLKETDTFDKLMSVSYVRYFLVFIVMLISINFYSSILFVLEFNIPYIILRIISWIWCGQFVIWALIFFIDDLKRMKEFDRIEEELERKYNHA